MSIQDKKMSSPTKMSKSPVGIREGTRVILREITANLQNSPTSTTASNKAGADSVKSSEHEVKVKFAREFIDTPITQSTPSETPSISSASSFQSLTSTQSAKSSSISATSPSSPSRSSETSYTNPEVSDLDDLISACAGIRLDDTVSVDQSLADVSFASASDEPIENQAVELPSNVNQIIPTELNETKLIPQKSNPGLNVTQELSIPAVTVEVSEIYPNVTIIIPNEKVISPEYLTASESLLQTSPINVDDKKIGEKDESTSIKSSDTEHLNHQKVHCLNETFDAESPSLQTIPSITLKTEGEFKEPLPPKPLETQRNVSPFCVETDELIETKSAVPESKFTFPDLSGHCVSAISEPTFIEGQTEFEESEEKKLDTNVQIEVILRNGNVEAETVRDEDNVKNEELCFQAVGIDGIIPSDIQKEEESPDYKDQEVNLETEELDKTITFQDTPDSTEAPEAEQYEAFKPQRQSTEAHPRPDNIKLPTDDEYLDFAPKRQSTGLNGIFNKNQETFENNEDYNLTPFIGSEQQFFDANDKTPTNAGEDFEQLKAAEAESIAKDIINTSLELTEGNDQFATATSTELLFGDPSSFDFLENQSSKSTVNRLRESLFIKFDPLVSNTSMLPQGNMASPPTNADRNGDENTSLPHNTTPKQNPAIAAIDRLLFYSPMPANTIQKNEEPEKIEPVEEPERPSISVDEAMAKELELVRSTVLQLEEQLEKEKEEKRELEKQSQETVSQLQKQLAQEIKNKNQINVVVDEYEKSISRLVSERERDKKNLDAEKSALMEELQEVKNHLAATEAAFNDVHAKYERLKLVVTASKHNETALKESLAENVEIIKALENRYEQIKSHAAARLEKANQDLDTIRKQNESEMVKLRAILRKEELKSNSLAEIVEQKTKENKELTQILDEVIARVGAKSDD